MTLSRLFKSLFILSFLLVSLVGIFNVFHLGQHGISGNCTASLLDGEFCPQDIYASTLHHLSVFETFSRSIFSSGTSLIILAVLLVFFLGYFWLRGSLNTSSYSFVFKFKETICYIFYKVRHWFSLLENSPSSI